MTFNNCSTCGTIRETATIRLNKLKKKMDDRRYLLTHGGVEEQLERLNEKDLLWEWAEEIKHVLGQI